MDVFAVHQDGREQLLASGLDSGKAGELGDWWRYTKPFGPGVKIVVRSNLQDVVGWSTAGTQLGPPAAVEAPHSEIHIG